MAYRYSIRNVPDGDASGQKGWTITWVRLKKRLRGKGPFTLFYLDKGYDRELHLEELGARMHELFRNPRIDRITVRPDKGPNVAVRRHEVKKETSTRSATDTPGTPAIDKIYNALHKQFDSQWLVRDMGICVDKPGQHGECNAWDAGTSMNVSADETHRRILVMAKWLRRQGIKHMLSFGKYGLPVWGIIVLDKYWKRGLRLVWRKYSGVAHVSHFHVSGFPSHYGDWI